MENIRAFEAQCRKLNGHILKDVYYENDALGFFNVREEGIKHFEYIPLSRLCMEMHDNIFFDFFDSLRFLEHYGYNTLDLGEHDEMASTFIGKNQSSYFLWKPYINKQIEKVEILWDSIKQKHHDYDPTDIYPRSLVLYFSDKLTMVIVAGELDSIDSISHQCHFRIPDEALILFPSIELYEKYSLK